MASDDNVIDVEAEEIEGSDNLPAVIPRVVSAKERAERAKRQMAAAEAEMAELDNPSRSSTEGTYVGDAPIGQETQTPDRRCRAHKKTGERCKNAAILGGTVCRFHGGAAKHVKAAARARLENAADLMAKELLKIALTADSESVALAAVRDSLDRAGLRPPAEVVLSQGENKPYEELFEGIASGSREASRRARRGVLDAEDSGDTSPSRHSAEAHADAGEDVLASAPGEYEDLRPEYVARDDGSPSYQGRSDPSAKSAAREPGPRRSDRERESERPQRHIQGMDAVREANRANLEIGALKAIESPHKRYKRPG